MDFIRFQTIEYLMLLWGLPLIIALIVFAGRQRQQALEKFVDPKLLPVLSRSVSPGARRWKNVLLVFCLALGVIALARPAWNPVPQTINRQGRDVVFLLDVSKSMLAEDLVPNRLERSKIAIGDVIEKLQGDRVALVVFAGNTVVKCPLTLDYGFFKMALEVVGPDSVSRGGTMVGDALRTVLTEVFDDQEKQFKDVILITDGEDHDSFAVEAAGKLGERGVRLITIGIGDENQGQRIPLTNEQGQKTFLTYKGAEVWSKLNGAMLRDMVNATPGGRYLNVATGNIDLGEVYLNLIVTADKKALESQTIKRYEEKFHIFLGLMFLLLCAELLWSERKPSRQKIRFFEKWRHKE
ncbi:MAG: VWA domain-containing protein [SAR324 cluster bacterium]|nr:VWA domain-containing protein [SAR324 cluster bacterium]